MHSSRSRICSLASVAVGAAALVLSAQIHAVPQYRVFNLGVISGNNQSKAFGLNDQGAIVGVSTGSLGGNRAFFWLFENMYGYNNPFVMQQLAAATATANDINNAGIAVGKKTVGGNELAHSWTLDSGTVTAANLGALSSGEGEDSEAFAINDAANAVIVGASDFVNEDVACPDRPLETAFKYVLDGSPSMELFGSVGTQVDSAAFGLNNDSNPLVAGTRQFTECDHFTFDCLSEFDANAWVSGTADQLTSISGFATDLYHEAQDANDDGNFAGSGDVDEDAGIPVVCGRRAIFWASTAASATVLNADSASDDARGNAITNIDACDMTRVVGQNISDQRALYWEHDGSSWSVAVLENQLLSTCFVDDIIEATDINANGWIVGYGDTLIGAGQTVRAVLLLPMVESCYADLTGDCKVNGTDLAILLGDWEESYCATRTCWGDLECVADEEPDPAGDVDGFDLAILLNAWTGENLCSEDCVEGWGSCSGGGESSQSSEGEGTNPTLIAELI